MSLKKKADIESPHATFKARGDWEWRVLRVPATSKKSMASPYHIWHVAARSPMTFGSWEYGDTYASEVFRFGTLIDATSDFADYLGELRRARSAA